MMLNYISEEDVEAIRKGREEALVDAMKGFASLDYKNEGYVCKTDLIAMISQGLELTHEQVEEFFKTFDLE